MEFFQNHRILSTLIVLVAAAAITVLLFILSSSAGVKPGSGTTTTPADTAARQYLETDDAAAASPAVPDSGTRDSIEAALAVDAGPGVVESTQNLDIDGDGTMETLVLVRQEGDARPLDWYLLKVSGSDVQKLFERTKVAHGEVGVEGPRIVESEGLYAPGDDACCPSEVATTYYVWKEGGLVASRVERLPAGPPA